MNIPITSNRRLNILSRNHAIIAAGLLLLSVQPIMAQQTGDVDQAARRFSRESIEASLTSENLRGRKAVLSTGRKIGTVEDILVEFPTTARTKSGPTSAPGPAQPMGPNESGGSAMRDRDKARKSQAAAGASTTHGSPRVYVLIKSGGFLGMGEAWVGVPAGRVKFDRESEVWLDLNDTEWAELEGAARYPNSAN